MFKTGMRCGAIAVVVGSALLLTPGIIEAQHGGGHGGGGHGGGGHAGGGHAGGGGHGGGARPGGGGARPVAAVGSWNHGVGSWNHSVGHVHPYVNNRAFVGFGGWGGWGYPGYYGGYWNPGYYGNYGYGYPDYYGTNAYVTPAIYADVPQGYQASYPPVAIQGAYSPAPPDQGNAEAPPADPNVAVFVVRVPDPNAEVWFQDQKTQQQGTVREYETEALDPNKSYTFKLRARWMQNGRPVEATREIQARPGQIANVVFTPPSRERVAIPKVQPKSESP